jgi:hypothetical protein
MKAFLMKDCQLVAPEARFSRIEPPGAAAAGRTGGEAPPPATSQLRFVVLLHQLLSFWTASLR